MDIPFENHFATCCWKAIYEPTKNQEKQPLYEDIAKDIRAEVWKHTILGNKFNHKRHYIVNPINKKNIRLDPITRYYAYRIGIEQDSIDISSINTISDIKLLEYLKVYIPLYLPSQLIPCFNSVYDWEWNWKISSILEGPIILVKDINGITNEISNITIIKSEKACTRVNFIPSKLKYINTLLTVSHHIQFLQQFQLAHAQQICFLLSKEYPNIEYIPCLVSILHILLTILSPAETYVCIESMIEMSAHRNIYFFITPDEYIKLCYSGCKLLGTLSYKQYKIFEKFNIHPGNLFYYFLTTFFIYLFPQRTVYMIFDYFLLDGIRSIIIFSIAFQLLYENIFLKCINRQELLYNIQVCGNIYNTDQLIKFALKLNITLTDFILKDINVITDIIEEYKYRKLIRIKLPFLKEYLYTNYYNESNCITLRELLLLYHWSNKKYYTKKLKLLFNTLHNGYSLEKQLQNINNKPHFLLIQHNKGIFGYFAETTTSSKYLLPRSSCFIFQLFPIIRYYPFTDILTIQQDDNNNKLNDTIQQNISHKYDDKYKRYLFDDIIYITKSININYILSIEEDMDINSTILSPFQCYTTSDKKNTSSLTSTIGAIIGWAKNIADDTVDTNETLLSDTTDTLNKYLLISSLESSSTVNQSSSPTTTSSSTSIVGTTSRYTIDNTTMKPTNIHFQYQRNPFLLCGCDDAWYTEYTTTFIKLYEEIQLLPFIPIQRNSNNDISITEISKLLIKYNLFDIYNYTSMNYLAIALTFHPIYQLFNKNISNTILLPPIKKNIYRDTLFGTNTITKNNIQNNIILPSSIYKDIYLYNKTNEIDTINSNIKSNCYIFNNQNNLYIIKNWEQLQYHIILKIYNSTLHNIIYHSPIYQQFSRIPLALLIGNYQDKLQKTFIQYSLELKYQYKNDIKLQEIKLKESRQIYYTLLNKWYYRHNNNIHKTPIIDDTIPILYPNDTCDIAIKRQKDTINSSRYIGLVMCTIDACCITYLHLYDILSQILINFVPIYITLQKQFKKHIHGIEGINKLDILKTIQVENVSITNNDDVTVTTTAATTNSNLNNTVKTDNNNTLKIIKNNNINEYCKNITSKIIKYKIKEILQLSYYTDKIPKTQPQFRSSSIDEAILHFALGNEFIIIHGDTSSYDTNPILLQPNDILLYCYLNVQCINEMYIQQYILSLLKNKEYTIDILDEIFIKSSLSSIIIEYAICKHEMVYTALLYMIHLHIDAIRIISCDDEEYEEELLVSDIQILLPDNSHEQFLQCGYFINIYKDKKISPLKFIINYDTTLYNLLTFYNDNNYKSFWCIIAEPIRRYIYITSNILCELLFLMLCQDIQLVPPKKPQRIYPNISKVLYEILMRVSNSSQLSSQDQQEKDNTRPIMLIDSKQLGIGDTTGMAVLVDEFLQVGYSQSTKVFKNPSFVSIDNNDNGRFHILSVECWGYI